MNEKVKAILDRHCYEIEHQKHCPTIDAHTFHWPWPLKCVPCHRNDALTDEVVEATLRGE